LLDAADVEQSEERTLAAVAAADNAEKLWPALDLSGLRGSALIQLGILRAAQNDAAVKAALPALLMKGSALVNALAGGGHPDVKAALLARPEWKDALALFVTSARDEPSLRVWSLATLLGDTALAEKHHGALEGRDAITIRIHKALAPYNEEAQQSAALLSR